MLSLMFYFARHSNSGALMTLGALGDSLDCWTFCILVRTCRRKWFPAALILSTCHSCLREETRKQWREDGGIKDQHKQPGSFLQHLTSLPHPHTLTLFCIEMLLAMPCFEVWLEDRGNEMQPTLLIHHTTGAPVQDEGPVQTDC